MSFFKFGCNFTDVYILLMNQQIPILSPFSPLSPISPLVSFCLHIPFFSFILFCPLRSLLPSFLCSCYLVILFFHPLLVPYGSFPTFCPPLLYATWTQAHVRWPQPHGGPGCGHDVIENFKTAGSGWKLVRRLISVCRLQKHWWGGPRVCLVKSSKI